MKIIAGIYLMLSAFAIWTTYQQPTKASIKLRIVTMITYILRRMPLQVYDITLLYRLFVLLLHYVGRSVMFGLRRSLVTASTELQPWAVPASFVSKYVRNLLYSFVAVLTFAQPEHFARRTYHTVLPYLRCVH